MKLYHGTSSEHLAGQRQHGLHDPFLAKGARLARYYAEETAEEYGGDPVVLLVRVRDLSRLRYDGAAMDEPVMANEKRRDAAWRRVAHEHPDWVEGDTIIVPVDQWKVSYDAVGSVWYDGTIPPTDFIVFQA